MIGYKVFSKYDGRLYSWAASYQYKKGKNVPMPDCGPFCLFPSRGLIPPDMIFFSNVVLEVEYEPSEEQFMWNELGIADMAEARKQFPGIVLAKSVTIL